MEPSTAPLRYSRDAPFDDPVVRCCECQTLNLMRDLQRDGCCRKCGTRRVRNVLTFDYEEMQWMRERNVDSEWLALFEVTADA